MGQHTRRTGVGRVAERVSGFNANAHSRGPNAGSDLMTSAGQIAQAAVRVDVSMSRLGGQGLEEHEHGQ